MKKCPFCGAEIEENARFCLYCMTSLEEKQVIQSPQPKNRRWLYIIAAVLLLLLLIGGVLWKTVGQANTDRPADPESENEVQNDPDTTESIPTQTAALIAGTPDRTGRSTVADTPVGNIGNAQTTVSRPGGSGITTKSTSAPAAVTTARQTVKPVQVTPTTPSPSAITYTYREGTSADCYPAGDQPVQAPQDVIVITGVSAVSPNGVYEIPETINGKKVGAIMSSAFSDAAISGTVRAVYLPSSVRMIWNGAFKTCYNLTDIYLASAVIGIEETAFPATAKRAGTLTIHCAADCRDFDYYYYRNIATRYDAVYEEWNG